MNSQHKSSFLTSEIPEEINIFNLASLINDKVGNKNSNHFTYLYLGNDPLRRRPDIALAKSFLLWSPKISLSEGIDKTINYFKENNLS